MHDARFLVAYLVLINLIALVTFGWFFDRSETMGKCFLMIKNAFTCFIPSQLLDISTGTRGTVPSLLIIAIGSLIMVFLGILQESGKDPYNKINVLPAPAIFLIYTFIFLLIGFFGSTAAPRGFIYAQF